MTASDQCTLTAELTAAETAVSRGGNQRSSRVQEQRRGTPGSAREAGRSSAVFARLFLISAVGVSEAARQPPGFGASHDSEALRRSQVSQDFVKHWERFSLLSSGRCECCTERFAPR